MEQPLSPFIATNSSLHFLPHHYFRNYSSTSATYHCVRIGNCKPLAGSANTPPPPNPPILSATRLYTFTFAAICTTVVQGHCFVLKVRCHVFVTRAALVAHSLFKLVCS